MADQRQNPNILLLLTDQERYDCTAPDGPPVETPTLDNFRTEGMQFRSAYTPTSICTSARASLLTGLYPHAHGLLNNSHEADAIQRNLPPDLPTFSAGLADAGYDLTYTGKWHVGDDQTPEGVGFRYLGGSDTHHDDIDDAFADYREELGQPLEEVTLEEELYTADGTLVSGTTPVDVEATRAAFLADRTIEAIEAHVESDTDRPFFHRADFLGPHHPYVIPEPYATMYDPMNVEPPGSYRETFDGKPAVHDQYRHYRGVADFDWDMWARAIAKYWGFVTLIDDQIGRVLEALEESGLAEETVVVHTADHGDFVGGHRQFNKGPLMYEDTYHIPLQIRWPGVVEPGTVCDELVRLHDLAPTFLEIGGATIPDTLEGHSRSLLPLLEGGVAESDDVDGSENGDVGGNPDETTGWPDAVCAEYHGDEFGLYTQRMIRTDRYKFIYNGPDRNELYDLSSDPDELQNLTDHPDYADIRRELGRKLAIWMDETDDPNRAWVPQTLE